MFFLLFFFFCIQSSHSFDTDFEEIAASKFDQQVCIEYKPMLEWQQDMKIDKTLRLQAEVFYRNKINTTFSNGQNDCRF